MRRLGRLVTCLTILAVFGGTAAHSQHKRPAHVSEDVYQALKSGEANVLVVLEVPQRGQMAELATAIATTRAAVLAGVPPRAYEVRAEFSHIPALSLRVDAAAIDLLANNPLVKAINLDHQIRLFDAEADALTHSGDVVSSGFTGESIRIAVIDSGINPTHVELVDDLFHQRCFRTENDCPNSNDPNDATDQNGHGTHVAGIITGAGGVAPDAEIAALKVFTTSDTSDTNILNALNYVIANNGTLDIRAINMSLGGDNYTTRAACDADNASYVTAFATLNGLNITNFVATGNDASTTSVSAPGCVTGAVGVGSVSDSVFSIGFSACTENGQPDKVTCFSNTTADQNDATELTDVLAPGCRITAEWIGSNTATNTICGTSMATPMTAGIAATLLSVDPSLTPQELEELLESTGDMVTDYRNSVQYPRVDAFSAFSELAISLDTPQNLVATTVGASQIDLDWDDVDDETEFHVQRSVDDSNWSQIGTSVADVTSFVDSAPPCGEVYYRVRAADPVNVQYSLFSNVDSDTARACPLAPTALAATVVDPSTVDLEWVDSATDETGYSLERSANGGPFVEIASLDADSEDHTDSGFACAGYSYRVRALRAPGDGSDYSNVAVANPCAPANDLIANAEAPVIGTPDVEPNIRYATISVDDPSPTCRFSGAAQGSNSVWYAFTPPANIDITVETTGSNLVPPGGDPDLNDTILAIYTGSPGALTQVACNDDVGGSNLLSRISNFVATGGVTYYLYVTRWSSTPMAWDGSLVVAFSQNLPTPTGLTATAASSSQIDLAWTPAGSPATETRIERRTLGGSFTEIAAVEVPGGTYPDSPLACDVYQYRARSFSTGTTYSAYTPIVQAAPLGCNLAPTNDLFTNSEVVSGASYADTEPNGRHASRDSTDPPFPALGVCTGGFPRDGSQTIWYSWTAPANGSITVSTTGSTQNTSNLDTVIGVFTHNGSAFTAIACDDEGGAGSTSQVQDLAVTAGTTYHFHIGRYSATPTTSVVTYVVSFTNLPVGAPGVTVTPTSGLVTTEAGGEDTFTVVLTTEPTGDVIIDVASDDAGEGTADPAQLTFTSGNWDTEQTVTVTGADDDVDDGDLAYTIEVTVNASTADAAYEVLDPDDVAVTNSDDDTAGITVDPTSGLVTTEEGGEGTFTVVLDSEPTGEVVIDVASDDAGEGSADPAQITFTSGNWSDARTVTVAGVDDLVNDGDQSYTVVLSMNAATADVVYDTQNPDSVSVTNLDDPSEGTFFTIVPCRLLDMREAGQGPALGSGSSRVVIVHDECGIPVTARAVALNVTVVNAGGLGRLTLHASDQPLPDTSTINFSAGAVRANKAIVRLATGGTFTISAVVTGGGTVEAIVDLMGYFE
jgi:hypothetical protein